MDIQKDNRLLLRPSITGTLGLLLVCSIFVAVGVWMASGGKMTGWFISCFFGLGIMVALVHLLPNASYLLLTESGFETRTMYRSGSFSWNEIAFFATARIGLNKMVVFNFSDHYDKAKMGRRFARTIAGFEGALPDTYGMKADDLARLLSEWKNRFDQR